VKNMHSLVGLALMLGIMPASAECVQWGTQVNNGMRICIAEDLVNRNPIIPDTAPNTFRLGPPAGAITITSGNGITITSHAPKCPEGWSLVAAPRPMCANELREPE